MRRVNYFEFERMEEIIRKLQSPISAAEVVNTLLGEVERFSGAAKQKDDITVVVMRVFINLKQF